MSDKKRYDMERIIFLQWLAELKSAGEYDDHVAELRAGAVRFEAERGVVIDGTAVRRDKPQPHLTNHPNQLRHSFHAGASRRSGPVV